MPVISILNIKGGTGKSISTMWLATAATYSDQVTVPVHVADGDVAQGTLSAWYEDAQAAHVENPELPSPNFDLISGNYTQLLRGIKKVPKKDLVFVDGSPGDHSMVRELSALSDLVIIPTKGTPGELEQVLTIAERLRADNIPYRIIFTMWKKSANVIQELRDVLDSLDEPYIWPPIADTAYLSRAYGTLPRNHFKDMEGYDSLLEKVLEQLND